MNYEEILIINQNLFFGSRLFGYFLSGCEENQIDFIVVYLLFLVLYKSYFRIIFFRVNVRFILDFLFFFGYNKFVFVGIEVRFYYFEDFINKFLIVVLLDLGIKVFEKILIDVFFLYLKEQNVSMKIFYCVFFCFG